MRLKNLFSSPIALLPIILIFCTSKQTFHPSSILPATSNDSNNVVIEIREAEGHDEYVSTPLATTSTLSREAADSLLNRLQPLTVDEPAIEFTRRDKSKPLPRTGVSVESEFPSGVDLAPPQAYDIDTNEPLKVMRMAPQGEVEHAPHVSITYNRPMVRITSHDDPSQKVPVTLTPQPKGSWRWMGTRTLIFQAESGALPQATDYELIVDKNATCTDGKNIGGERRFSFSTPAVKVSSHYPTGTGIRTDAPIFIAFNQRVHSESIASFITVKAENEEIQFRTGKLQELPDHFELLQSKAEQAGKDRWILLFPDHRFPASSTVHVSLAKRAPSLEGPGKTTAEQSFTFKTFEPLIISSRSCSDNSNNICNPEQIWHFSTNNRIDSEYFDSSMVTITPAVEGLHLYSSERGITIKGHKKPATQFEIEFSREIRDLFGQHLSGQNRFTLYVGNSIPRLDHNYSNISLVDPVADPSVQISTVNYSSVAVHLWRVQPKDWPQYSTNYWRYAHGHRSNDSAWLKEIPGTLILTDTIALQGKLNSRIVSEICLKEYLSEGKGHLIVRISAADHMQGTEKKFLGDYRPALLTWLQGTNIGIDTWKDPSSILALATSLDKAAPLSGVSLYSDTHFLGTTGTDGSLAFDLDNRESSLLLAVFHNDTAFIPFNIKGDHRPDRALFHVFDDRAFYRPDEKVQIKGWVRKLSYYPGADIAFFDSDLPLSYTVIDSRRNPITKGQTMLSPLGGFDLSFHIPSTSNLGRATVRFKLGTFQFQHSFEIQEFRTPEFEVNINLQEGPFFSGEKFRTDVNCSYYAGGGLSAAPVNWKLVTEQAFFTPPNRQQYSFGEQLPWFWNWMSIPSKAETVIRKEFDGTTDFLGNHAITALVNSGELFQPLSLTIQTSVTDVNRQQWTSKQSALIHPSRYYVGLKTERYNYEPGKEIPVEWIVTDVDGEIVSGVSINFLAQRTETRFKGGFLKDTVVESHEARLQSGNNPSNWKFTPQRGGNWKITAVLQDEHGGHNLTAINRWVRDNRIQRQNRVETQKAMIFPDQDTYNPGDTATLFIQLPFAPAEGYLLLNRMGIVEKRRISLTETHKEIAIPIRESFVPNLYVQVNVSGIVPRTDGDGQTDSVPSKQPAIAAGTINLPISTVNRTLAITATPDKSALAPGESTNVDIQVNDSRGRPVPDAEVAVIIVDEAILSLSNYLMKDPLEMFYNTRPSLVNNSHNRPYVVLSKRTMVQPDQHEKQAADPSLFGYGGFANDSEVLMGSAMMESEAPRALAQRRGVLGIAADAPPSAEDQSSIAVRTNFNPLAAFHPAGSTDKNGQLTVSFKLPDNLTRYRIMVVAADGAKNFGITENNITARLPLMVRPSPPRFLNFGDSLELPVVLQNQTDHNMAVAIVSRAHNVTLKSQGYKVTVPANDRVEVRFPASTITAGTARFQVAAASGNFTDAAHFSIPVWTPATTESFATYGTVDHGAVSHLVKRPHDVWPQFGGVQVSTSSTALQALTDAFIYLYNYRFTSSEQLASKIISVAALSDVLNTFQVPEIPSVQEIQQQMDSDIRELQTRQNRDGGFGFWSSSQRSMPFSSLHVIHALTRAQQKGYTVPLEVSQRAKSYLVNIKQLIPHSYSSRARHTIIAYSLYVRSLGGDFDQTQARSLLSESNPDDWSLESLGWLLYTLSRSPDTPEVNKVLLHLHNSVHETASTAQFNQSISEEDGHLVFHSSRRADAVILEALMQVQSDSELIAKLVRGLLGHRKAGRWSNTQENGFVLLALDTYFNKYESPAPDFLARVWLGPQYAGDHSFKGRTTETHRINIPMHTLADEDSVQNLLLQKQGRGRMYYRIGMDYAPKSLRLDAADHGFHVQRHYEGWDSKQDVVQRKDGVWEIRAGARVKVTVMMVAPGRRYHVALIDALPAGLEVLNPALAVTAELPEESTLNRFWWWSRPWYEHQNIRDERVEAFSTLVHGGVYEYVYYARATTLGSFVVPPAKVEEMYAPETFGRSASDQVMVIPNTPLP